VKSLHDLIQCGYAAQKRGFYITSKKRGQDNHSIQRKFHNQGAIHEEHKSGAPSPHHENTSNRLLENRPDSYNNYYCD